MRKSLYPGLNNSLTTNSRYKMFKVIFNIFSNHFVVRSRCKFTNILPPVLGYPLPWNLIESYYGHCVSWKYKLNDVMFITSDLKSNFAIFMSHENGLLRICFVLWKITYLIHKKAIHVRHMFRTITIEINILITNIVDEWMHIFVIK